VNIAGNSRVGIVVINAVLSFLASGKLFFNSIKEGARIVQNKKNKGESDGANQGKGAEIY